MSNENQRVEHERCLGHIQAPCPYLDGRESNLRFIDGVSAGVRYRSLLDAGYRRHGLYLYRPDCLGCSECKVIRVPVARFAPSRSQRRVWTRGQSVFTVSIAPPGYSDEKAAMYQAYLHHQHGSDKDDIDAHRYDDFFVHSCLGPDTFELQLHADGRLAGVGLLDRVGDALSSVYFYFDPVWARFSPGVFSAIAEIELARRWRLNFYYLGYYIAGCRTMEYKAQYRPCEVCTPGHDWEEWN